MEIFHLAAPDIPSGLSVTALLSRFQNTAIQLIPLSQGNIITASSQTPVGIRITWRAGPTPWEFVFLTSSGDTKAAGPGNTALDTQ